MISKEKEKPMLTLFAVLSSEVFFLDARLISLSCRLRVYSSSLYMRHRCLVVGRILLFSDPLFAEVYMLLLLINWYLFDSLVSGSRRFYLL